jgi:hypothetical protein
VFLARFIVRIGSIKQRKRVWKTWSWTIKKYKGAKGVKKKLSTYFALGR